MRSRWLWHTTVPLTVGCGVEAPTGCSTRRQTRSREAGSVVLHRQRGRAAAVGSVCGRMGKVSSPHGFAGRPRRGEHPEEPRRIAPVGAGTAGRAAQIVDIAPYSIRSWCWMNNPEKPKTMNLKKNHAGGARVRADPRRALGRGKRAMPESGSTSNAKRAEIDRNIYGNFVEHLGRCIYGGLIEPGSPLSTRRGYRRTCSKRRGRFAHRGALAGRQLRPGYHWEDGTGPQAGRPTRTTRHGASARATRSAPMSSSSGAAVPRPSPISA